MRLSAVVLVVLFVPGGFNCIGLVVPWSEVVTVVVVLVATLIVALKHLLCASAFADSVVALMAEVIAAFVRCIVLMLSMLLSLAVVTSVGVLVVIVATVLVGISVVVPCIAVVVEAGSCHN